MTLLNIFLASLRPNNLILMTHKFYLRFFDKKNSISKVELMDWLESKKINYSKFCEKIDPKLWSEAQTQANKINFYAREKLKDIKYDLGGSAAVDFLYFCVRFLKPETVVETGVAAGYSSMAILQALNQNNFGHLYSSDFPYFRISNPKKFIGILVPDKMKDRWSLHIDGDKKNIKKIKEKIKKIELFHYDSDKSYTSRKTTIKNLNSNFYDKTWIIMDDISDNTFFYDYVKSEIFSKQWIVFKKDNKWIGVIYPKQN